MTVKFQSKMSEMTQITILYYPDLDHSHISHQLLTTISKNQYENNLYEIMMPLSHTSLVASTNGANDIETIHTENLP